MLRLTISNPHYLKAVYRLGGGAAGTRVSDIAQALGVSRASACNGVKALEKKGFATRSVDHKVFLTEEGMCTAYTLEENYAVVERFFEEILCIGSESAASQACTLEHSLTPDAFDALSRFIRVYRYSGMAG